MQSFIHRINPKNKVQTTQLLPTLGKKSWFAVGFQATKNHEFYKGCRKLYKDIPGQNDDLRIVYDDSIYKEYGVQPVYYGCETGA